MSIESTKEYKEDRVNVRNINSIIVTGKCYKYKDNYYELEENDGRLHLFTNPAFEFLKNKVILLNNILTKEKFTLDESSFELFIKVEQQLL